MTGLPDALVDRQPFAVLLQQRLADPLHFQQLIYRRERPIAIAVGDDRLGFGGTDTKQITTQGLGVGGVQVHLGGLLGLVDLRGNGRWGFGLDRRGGGGGDGESGEESEDQGRNVGVLHK